MNNSQENYPYEQARIALLKYYNSQCMTHGGYLIAILIGLLTIISRWTTYAANIIGWIWGIVALLIALCAYTIGRIFWWGSFASEVLHVGKKEIEEEKKKQSEEEKKNATRMSILHKATSHKVYEKHPLTGLFYKCTSKIRNKTSNELRKFVPVRICPYCENWIPSKSNFCPKCETNLQPKKTT